MLAYGIPRTPCPITAVGYVSHTRTELRCTIRMVYLASLVHCTYVVACHVSHGERVTITSTLGERVEDRRPLNGRGDHVDTDKAVFTTLLTQLHKPESEPTSCLGD